ncbi:MAG: glutaredoxin [Nitrospira sp.]|nr:glutaredoxin [Nitrospira sp.]
MSITLFHVNWCPDCVVVRRKLDELGLAYDGIIAPDIRSMRKQVHAVSGQYYVPVLQDGDLILTETEDILAYLDSRAGSGSAESTTQFRSQARTSPESPSEDDNHPSCCIN